MVFFSPHLSQGKCPVPVLLICSQCDWPESHRLKSPVLALSPLGKPCVLFLLCFLQVQVW